MEFEVHCESKKSQETQAKLVRQTSSGGRRGADLATSDIHIYYFQKNPEQLKFAKELWERIRRECKILTKYHRP
jgi:hypothetical protein